MRHKFLTCGLLGWCLEIFWTGLHTLSGKDFRLVGHSSLWMFPIYGMASFIAPLSRKLQSLHWPFPLRGMVYTAGIFVTEYSTGFLLKKYNLCPWDYTGCHSNINGLIRLDYAPVWFLAGLFYEKNLSPKGLAFHGEK